MIRKAFIIITIGIMASVIAVLPSKDVSAASRVGGVSVWNACIYQHGSPSYLTVTPYNVTGWRCVYSGGWNSYQRDVDLNRECRRTYGSRAYAAYTDFNNPHSWGCYR